MGQVSERQWVEELRPRLETALAGARTEGYGVKVATCKSLPYAHEIQCYSSSGEAGAAHAPRYETDLLVYDERLDGSTWVPRVIIECKVRQVTTHDALTYSTKAATHKHVHPYVRYGILLGGLSERVPPRVIRHGVYFDFIAAWPKDEPTDAEWSAFVAVLRDEISASRVFQRLMAGELKGSAGYGLVHRPLVLK